MLAATISEIKRRTLAESGKKSADESKKYFTEIKKMRAKLCKLLIKLSNMKIKKYFLFHKTDFKIKRGIGRPGYQLVTGLPKFADDVQPF